VRFASPLLAVATLAITLAALEGATRVLVPASERASLPHVGLDRDDEERLRWLDRPPASEGAWALDEPDPLLGWRPRAGAHARDRRPGSYDVEVHIDVHGLRATPPAGGARAAGAPRIAAFGCSQSFGTGVADHETWPAQLGHLLPAAEVLNFGVRGYGTDQMLLRFERDGRPRQPTVVVLGFAYYHILRNVSAFRFYAKPRFTLDADGTLQLAGVPIPPPDELRRTMVPPRPWPVLDQSVLARWTWGRVLAQERLALFRTDTDAWRLTRALLARFIQSAEESGAHVVLLHVEEDQPGIDGALAALAGELGAGFVSVGRTIAARPAGGGRLRLSGDPHWNAAGHRLIAEAVRAELCRRGLVACAGEDAAA